MFRLTLGAALITAVLAGQAVAQDTSTPLATVQALYGDRQPPRTDLGRYFVPDLAEAMQSDLATRQPVLAGDYRFDLGSRPGGELTFAEGESPNGAGVTVGFSGGQSVFVDLCRRADGQWRVADIRDPEEFWSTRAYMQLHLGRVECE